MNRMNELEMIHDLLKIIMTGRDCCQKGDAILKEVLEYLDDRTMALYADLTQVKEVDIPLTDKEE